MNHCLLEVKVQTPPTVRYTPDNKTPIAEVEALFNGLRPDDPPNKIKVVGWGRLAEELQNRIKGNEEIIIEGRLRMNTVPRQDGTKEKRAEFTLSRLHFSPQKTSDINDLTSSGKYTQAPPKKENNDSSEKEVSWNAAPLVPDTDEIPF